MCGRFAVYSKPETISKIFSIKQTNQFEISYNVAPTENVSVVVMNKDKEKIPQSMRWGLIPGWQAEYKVSMPLINARIETIDTKPSFKEAAKKRRCLIITDGFYEWQKVKKIRQPYFIHKKNNEPFALAGIWEKWAGEGANIYSCCIITLDANELLSPLHNRMPAIVKPQDYDAWLDPTNQNWVNVQHLLTDEPHHELTFYAVSTKVNNANYKGEACIKKQA